MILGKKRLAVRWFSICLIVLATVALAYLAISNGQAIQYMTWTYDTAGIYPDLFESIRDAADLHPYEGRSIYPPLTYLILWIFYCGSFQKWFREITVQASHLAKHL